MTLDFRNQRIEVPKCRTRQEDWSQESSLAKVASALKISCEVKCGTSKNEACWHHFGSVFKWLYQRYQIQPQRSLAEILIPSNLSWPYALVSWKPWKPFGNPWNAPRFFVRRSGTRRPEATGPSQQVGLLGIADSSVTDVHRSVLFFRWMCVFSRKRPRRVLSKKALPLKTVIKDCPKFCWSDGCLYRLSSKTAQSSAEVMAVFKDCHQRLPKVLLKWWLSSKIVIKDCLKFRWSDGCPARLSSKTAQSSAEVMAVLKDCHQRLPKVLLKWWLSLKIVIKDCLKFCWSDGCLQRREKRLQIFD